MVARLEANAQAALICRAAADGGHEVRDVRIARHDVGHGQLMVPHVLERAAFQRFGRALDLARVLRGDETAGHHFVKDNGPRQNPQGKEDGKPTPVHHPRQRPLVPAPGALIDALRRLVPPPVVFFLWRTEEAAAQHGGERQRYEPRHQNRDADRDGEFVEQAAEDAAHQQQRNEHRGERQRHRENREPDLARAVERRLQCRLPLLHVPDDVLEHHNRVVHDESHGERERHQRQIVEAVAHQVHHRERADDRERQREARDDRGGEILEEQEDHEDDQDQRDEQGDLHIVHRLADRHRAVVECVHLDGCGQQRRERCDRRLDAVRDLHRVRPRLTLDCQNDGALAVVPARVAGVLHVVDHVGDVLESYRRAVLIRHRELAEFRGTRDRTVGEHGIGTLRAPQRAGWQVRIPSRHRRRHLIQADAACSERLGIDLDAHCVLGGPEDLDLGDPAHRRQPLREERLGVFVELRERQRRRRQRQIEDRRVGGVRLVVRRRLDAGRQLPERLGNRGLHVLRRAIDVPGQRELQRDVRPTERAARRHRVEAGDRRELLLERRRDRGRHRLRTRARQSCRDGNRGEVDVGEVAHRQQPIRHQPEHEDPQHH